MTEKTVISLTSGILEKRETTENRTVILNAVTSQFPSDSGNEKLLPRYLRPHLASCHDLCKYGFKHDQQDEKKHSFLLRFLRNNQFPNGKQNQSNFIFIQQRKQKTALVTAQRRSQKPELRPTTSYSHDVLSNELELNEQICLAPEKFIHAAVTTTALEAEYGEEPSSWKLKTKPNVRTNDASLEHSVAVANEQSSKEYLDIATDVPNLCCSTTGLSHVHVTLKVDRPETQNDVDISGLVPTTKAGGSPTTKAGGSPEKPVSVKFVVSSTMEENVASPDCKGANPSDLLSVEHLRMELKTASPITNDTMFDECQTSKGEEDPSKEPEGIKMTPLPRSSEGPSSVKLINHKIKTSAKLKPAGRAELASKEGFGMKIKTSGKLKPAGRAELVSKEGFGMKIKTSGKLQPAGRAELASKEGFDMKLKTGMMQKIPASSVDRPSDQEGFSNTRIKLKSSGKYDKGKREMNKLKNGIKETAVTERRKVMKQEQDASQGPKFVKKNIAPRKTMNLVWMETKQRSFSSSTASVAPKVIKWPSLSSSKTIKGTNKSASTLNLKKRLVNSSSPSPSPSPSPSIYSKGSSGQRNQDKIIRVSNKLNGVSERVFERLSAPPSTQFTRVPSIKLRKNQKVLPSVDQTKAGRFSVKGKRTIRTPEPDLEKIDLKALRQKLRKLRLSPDKKEYEESGSRFNRAIEHAFHSEVPQIQRTHIDVIDMPKEEFKKGRDRIADVDSGDKIGSSFKLNFSRGKVISIQPENNTPPVRLRFRRVKMVGSNHIAKEIEIRSINNRTVSDARGSGASPPKPINVVLRHKDVDNKKDEKGLFNNMIEETAIRLAESRKSKVKALVGAFETVISLQENKVAPVVAVP